MDAILPAALLFGAGVAAGLAATIAGLASLVSYPALLATGLPPITANVTNTVALFSTTAGAVAGSRAELRGQWPRLRRLCVLTVAGGGLGAALLLNTPPEAFELIVPWLIALGALVLLARDHLDGLATRLRLRAATPVSLPLPLAVAVLLVGVYGGYFGAAAGIMMLAVLSVAASEPLPVTNAVKNVAAGAANVTAATTYAILAPVDWAAAIALGLGCLLGAWTGPALVRRLPERPLRIAIGLAGLALAAHLFHTAVFPGN
ncbi:sulfite exporter TauE/SafE family protein [Lipingzhangella sp. LS1_29]|uniref:Probable membrane transporter protein n=1 Tax=Lipingzhangella rawalii TaxID=2055835 RepID=A0ABU2H6G2_9ACTN|nr:sulfite exporter TauE/SafE family protein [Lipingzhangella rawalii]MDS1270897.1 sulfite exporter TauE/SafE family protein [Lipingzhangella rawalii]